MASRTILSRGTASRECRAMIACAVGPVNGGWPACVLYETLAGQPPFTGPTAQAIMARHSLDAVPRLKIVRDAIPDDLELVIERALEKVPADRYQTSGEFSKALTAASTGRVSRITAQPRRRRWSRRSSIIAAAVIALVVVA